MEGKKYLGEKPMRVLQCYCMFYGTVPMYEGTDRYADFYIKTQLMMSFLDSFGYSLLYTSGDEPLKRWYSPSNHFHWGDCIVSPDLDASIHAVYEEMEGKTREEVQEYYEESKKRQTFYDEEITERIGNLVKECKSRKDVESVLRELTTPVGFKKKLETGDYGTDLVELMSYAEEIFLPVVNLTKEYSINDPRYLEFVKKYLKVPEKNKEKKKEY